MDKAVVAQAEPYIVGLEKDQRYAWCACGRSANQPWCDGSHKDTPFRPVVWKATDSSMAPLCGCKQTNDQPYCDGSHEGL